MSLQVTGKIVVIEPTNVVSDKFKKREFVVSITENINGNEYTNYAKFQTVQNKCDLLDKFNEADTVTVSFNIKGNRWEKDGKVQYITNLDAWRIEAANGYVQGASGRNDMTSVNFPDSSQTNLSVTESPDLGLPF